MLLQVLDYARCAVKPCALLDSQAPYLCLLLYSDLAKDMGETSYSSPDVTTSIRASAGGASCAKFCLWGRGGKAYHPPPGADSAPVEFL